ncbi:MAG TPA: hypothetical protein VFQ00_05415 [Terriglobales bacterium]|nr:hypothetical protein [Terriglobales bacterium]
MLKKILTERELANRASTSVADFLFKRLMVPQVYIDVSWPNSKTRVDVLAIDRAGTGDIHVAEVLVLQGNSGQKLQQGLSKLETIPAHYKYLALFNETGRSLLPKDHPLFDQTGFGRVGVIRVREDESENLKAEFLVSPERFRPAPQIYRRADRLRATHKPDFEVRDY